MRLIDADKLKDFVSEHAEHIYLSTVPIAGQK